MLKRVQGKVFEKFVPHRPKFRHYKQVFHTFLQISSLELSDFCTKVTLDITYTLAILKFFGKVVIPLNPLKKTQIRAFWSLLKLFRAKKSTIHHFYHFYPLHDLPLPTQILFLSKNCKKKFSGQKFFSLNFA